MPALPRSLVRFGIVGLGTNGLLFGLYLLLLRAGQSAEASAALCYLLGIALAYLVNRSWSFESTASHRRDLPRYLLAYGVGLVFAVLFVAVVKRVVGPELAQLLNILATAGVIYVALRLLRFGQPGRADAG